MGSDKHHSVNSLEAFKKSISDSTFEPSTVKSKNLKKPSFDLDSAIKRSRVLITDVLCEPPKCLSILRGDSRETIGTLGNFSLVIGKPKAKKSFLLQLFINAALSPDDPNAFIGSTLPADKRNVLVFDAEQVRYKSQVILKNAERQVPGHLENLILYNLRESNAIERLQIIEKIIYSTPNLGVVFIDGVRELITLINDEEQATKVTSMLLKWTSELQIHICLVLHQNKNDVQARGHIGSELVNKAETVLSVTEDPRNKAASIVKAELCRDKEFQPFAFYINEEGLPLIVKDYVHSEFKSKAGCRAGWKPEEVPYEEHIKVLSSIWPTINTPSLKYGEFQEAIKMGFKEQGVTLSKSRASLLTAYYKKNGLLALQGRTPNTVYKYIKKEETSEVSKI